MVSDEIFYCLYLTLYLPNSELAVCPSLLCYEYLVVESVKKYQLQLIDTFDKTYINSPCQVSD